MNSTLTIRPMTAEEMDLAVDLAAAEGWNPGLHDAEPFRATDPEGFLIGLLNDEPVGCISAVSYGGTFGFMGFYIVLPEHRGKGYGMKLWERAIDHLNGHLIGGDGVFERLDDYRRSGFDAAYSNVRFEHRASGQQVEKKSGIVPASEVPFESILSYDAACFPAQRRTFLEHWLAMPESHAAAFVDGDRMQGYGVIRRCRTGCKIGPLFADNATIADALFQNLCSYAEPGEPVYLDVPDVNGPGMEMADRYGMKRVFGTGRIYNGPAPDIDLGRVFGVTSFELG